MKKVTVDNETLFALTKTHLDNHQLVELKVKGNSMLPFFRSDQTIVTLKKTDTYQKYDVVLFRYENRYILHRIIQIKNGEYILRGDGAFKKEKITKDHILGKVVSFHTEGKVSKRYLFKVKLWLFFTPMRRILLKFIKRSQE